MGGSDFDVCINHRQKKKVRYGEREGAERAKFKKWALKSTLNPS
jgi:hypothetical protein